MYYTQLIFVKFDDRKYIIVNLYMLLFWEVSFNVLKSMNCLMLLCFIFFFYSLHFAELDDRIILEIILSSFNLGSLLYHLKLDFVACI